MDFFATAAKGTEGAVRDELRSLRFSHVRATRGGVSFSGPLGEGYRACIHLRTAVRVLVEIGNFPAPSGDALYEGVSAFDWEEHLTHETTLAVRASLRSSALTHSQFVAQRTKDAIVDQLRDRRGARPDVNRDDPDAAIFVHLVKDHATLYLDLGGRPLHLRGYRKAIGDAPIKETLAACLLWLSDWDKSSPLIDPMCGSGTISIEAALMARKIAPGLAGPPFGFTRWASHDQTQKSRLRDLIESARSLVQEQGPEITGSDADPDMLGFAMDNAKRAGVKVAWTQASVGDLDPMFDGWVVVNPPYGERIEMSAPEKQAMGRAFSGLKQARLGLLAGAPSILSCVRRRPNKKIVLMNGDIECRFALFTPKGAT